ncbi:MAG: carboxypeptidase regulatory-like domain-containing protein [bacterium]|jgi:hypothetical protein
MIELTVRAMTLRPVLLVAILSVWPAAAFAGGADGPVRIAGRVVDENNAAIAGAQLWLRGGTADALRAISDPTGAFEFLVTAPGDYLITAERQGFFRIENRPVAVTPQGAEVTLVLDSAREVFERVEISYSPKAIDFDRTQPQENLSSAQLLEIPYPSTNTLRNAMRIIPGVTQDNRGGIHLNGGGEDQVLYTLDGFQINDPLTGRFESRMSMEAVRSMEATSLNPAEFGKGPAGTLAIKTSAGDDRFRYSGTNFIPGVETRKGLYVGGWTPRFNFSGPIRRGRAWFSESLDVQYDKTVVEELPEGQDRNSSWRVSNLFRAQVNLTPSNILSSGFLNSLWAAGNTGLGPLDPMETTVDRRSRQYFFYVKDQVYLQRGALIEFGYAAHRTTGREIPQGHKMLVYTPEGRLGNYFEDARRNAARDQLLASVFLPAFTAAGGHQLKTGIDISRVAYSQNIERTGYEFLRADWTVSRSTTFAGSGRFDIDNAEAAWFVQDSWKPAQSVLIEAGVRFDWDSLTGSGSWAPRLGVSWAPPRLESTKVSAGYGIVTEQSNLQLFSRPLDQYLLTTYYGPDGAYGPAISIFLPAGRPLTMPRYTHWSAGVEHRFPHDLSAGVRYTGRRGGNGLMYIDTLGSSGAPAGFTGAENAVFEAVYRLSNTRRDVYDAVQVTVRQTFRRQYEWLASYTRSRARSNAVIDIGAENPLVAAENSGPMPWDSPNRFLGWGYLPTIWEDWAVAFLVEARDGYPFSVYDSTGRIAGEVNSHRFPPFFELNLHLERRFSFRGFRWAFRFGLNNLTNHDNPNSVNSDTGAPNFLHMYGGQGRSLNFRIRWLGRG